MCMTDDEPTSDTCYDVNTASTGESSAEIQGAAPATSEVTSKLCPRCLIFWVIVAIIAFGSILYFRRK
jgi:hypothetical protein